MALPHGVDILLADDEATNHALVRAIAAHRGWTLHSVYDGRAAVSAALALRPRVTLMDIQMPILDGYAATKAIRERAGDGSGMAIVAFTALRPADARAHFISRGMDDHVAKPFDPAAVTAVLDRWLPGGPAPHARIVDLLGVDQAGEILARFRTQLAEALASLDEDPTALAGRAHRLGGLAGTLGYRALCDAWLALSDGDESARENVRLESRRALILLDTQ